MDELAEQRAGGKNESTQAEKGEGERDHDGGKQPPGTLPALEEAPHCRAERAREDDAIRVEQVMEEPADENAQENEA